jgi:multimeric flavodoxin WrbA
LEKINISSEKLHEKVYFLSVLILNGSLKTGDQHIIEQDIIEKMLASNGIPYESILLHATNLKNCIGCFKCWDTTPGICSGVKGDSGNEIISKVIHSDLIIFLTPLTFGGYSSEMKKVIERFLPLLQPGVKLVKGETHHKQRYDKYPSILAIATTEEFDKKEVQIFKHLLYRHSLNFFPPKIIAEVFDYAWSNGMVESLIEHNLRKLEVIK